MSTPNEIGTARLDAIVQALESAHKQLLATLAKLSADDWSLEIQENDQRWTVKQVLLHLVDAQRGMTVQMRAFQAGKEVIPPDFDLNRWNKRNVEKNADKTSEELLTTLNAGHEDVIALVKTLTAEDLDKIGRHSSLAMLSIEQLGHLIASHEATHAEEIGLRLGH
jgi:uncharacterized damage-inducible protein DinB